MIAFFMEHIFFISHECDFNLLPTCTSPICLLIFCFVPSGLWPFFPLLTWADTFFFPFFFLSGDRRPAQRAGRQRLQTGLPRHGQGEGKGRDDHLLPHQRPRRQLTSSQTLPSLTSAPAAQPGQPWSRGAKEQRSRRGRRRQPLRCLHMHTRRVVR